MFLGLVPYLIPVAWFMMTYPALVIAERAVPRVPNEFGAAWRRRTPLQNQPAPVRALADGGRPGKGSIEFIRRWGWRLAVAALGAVAMTAWDVAMDPMMVAGQHWVWETEGAYFGIPLQNFAGWWLTGFVTFALFAWLGKLPASRPAEERFDRLAVISYAATGLTSVLIDLQSGMGGAGMAGLFAMLPWVLWGWIGGKTPR